MTLSINDNLEEKLGLGKILGDFQGNVIDRTGPYMAPNNEVICIQFWHCSLIYSQYICVCMF